MIPRILHRVWIGSDPMPPDLAAYGETWGRHHPDWEHRLWTDENLPELRNRALYEAVGDYIPTSEVGPVRADIVRYELLWRFGGVYVDSDIECLRPIDELLDTDCFLVRETDEWICQAVFGAVPGHHFLAELIERLPAHAERWRRNTKRTSYTGLSGPKYLTRLLRELPDDVATIYPPEFFYPYSWKELHRAGEEFPDAYAVHHWRNARARLAARSTTS